MTKLRQFPRPWVVAVGLLLLAAVFYVLDPAQCAFFPGCPLHRWTGWYCPGCGASRALHELLHGHLRAAFRLNLLAVGALAGLLGLLGWQLVTGRRWWPLVFRPAVAYGLLAIAVSFGVLRNLPVAPWCYLAPATAAHP